MITHDEVRKTLNKTEMGESPTRLMERKLLIHDYVDQQETLEAKYEALVKENNELKDAVKTINKHGIIQFTNGNFDEDWNKFKFSKEKLSKVGKVE